MQSNSEVCTVVGKFVEGDTKAYKTYCTIYSYYEVYAGDYEIYIQADCDLTF